MTNEVPQTRRETMWIELLESIPAKEAELMDLVKDKGMGVQKHHKGNRTKGLS